MITDRTIFSARADNPKALARRAVWRLLTVSVAAALTLPSLAAWSMDSPRKTPAQVSQFDISLPAVPYIDTMRWLEWRPGGNSLKIDTLIVPTPDPSGIRLAPAQPGLENAATS